MTAEMLPNQTVFRAYPQGIYTFSKPFNRNGIVPIGGRTTIIRMTQPPNQGNLFVLASTPLDDATKAKVADILSEGGSSASNSNNKVGFLVAPDVVHSMYLQDWARAYPDALVVGVDGLQAKNPSITSWYGLYGVDPPSKTATYAFEPEIKAAYFPTFQNKDVVFFHSPTRTLLTADLIFNFPLREQYANTPAKRPAPWVPFFGSFSTALSPGKAMHASFLWSTGGANAIPEPIAQAAGLTLSQPGGSTHERRRHFGSVASLVAGWDPARIIMCHGDVIQDDDAGAGAAKRAWISAFSKYLNEDGSLKI